MAFRANDRLRDAIGHSLDRMLAFYGLRRSSAAASVRIELDPDRFQERAKHWLTPGNHNHLRLTRIMQSLSALGLLAEARALQRCLVDDIYEGPGRARITDDSYEFWLSAVPRSSRNA
jgi:hypothetical protein